MSTVTFLIAMLIGPVLWTGLIALLPPPDYSPRARKVKTGRW
jgi:hypothetical protein